MTDAPLVCIGSRCLSPFASSRSVMSNKRDMFFGISQNLEHTFHPSLPSRGDVVALYLGLALLPFFPSLPSEPHLFVSHIRKSSPKVSSLMFSSLFLFFPLRKIQKTVEYVSEWDHERLKLHYISSPKSHLSLPPLSSSLFLVFVPSSLLALLLAFLFLFYPFLSFF